MKIGDKLKIIEMKDEPQYNGREGVITSMNKDPWGDTQIHGTWGGCAIYPEIDTVTIIKGEL